MLVRVKAGDNQQISGSTETVIGVKRAILASTLVGRYGGLLLSLRPQGALRLTSVRVVVAIGGSGANRRVFVWPQPDRAKSMTRIKCSRALQLSSCRRGIKQAGVLMVLTRRKLRPQRSSSKLFEMADRMFQRWQRRSAHVRLLAFGGRWAEMASC